MTAKTSQKTVGAVGGAVIGITIVVLIFIYINYFVATLPHEDAIWLQNISQCSTEDSYVNTQYCNGGETTGIDMTGFKFVFLAVAFAIGFIWINRSWSRK